MPQTYQVVPSVGMGRLGILIGVLAGFILGNPGSMMLLWQSAASESEFSCPATTSDGARVIRQNTIAQQLSDVLDLLVVCVEAGMGLFEAIKSSALNANVTGRKSDANSLVDHRNFRGREARTGACAAWPTGPRLRISSRSPRP